ncbi:hypothetical protein GCM10011321_00280 [Youhaiella tibetensis]|nr:hypothetical protein [Youhaiella tibetensis]GGF12108.1 hypothetical protein GCM10011321_00280 [Youhaiella tibetensis]
MGWGAPEISGRPGGKKTDKALYDVLSKRAAQGHPAAVAALRKINPWPF